MAVKSQKCPDASVNTLPDGLIKISQWLQKVIATYIYDILSNSRKAKNCSGIFCIFFAVKYAVTFFNPVYNIGFIAAVNRRIHFLAASYQANDHPVTAKCSTYRCACFCQLCQMRSGFFVRSFKAYTFCGYCPGFSCRKHILICIFCLFCGCFICFGFFLQCYSVDITVTFLIFCCENIGFLSVFQMTEIRVPVYLCPVFISFTFFIIGDRISFRIPENLTEIHIPVAFCFICFALRYISISYRKMVHLFPSGIIPGL